MTPHACEAYISRIVHAADGTIAPDERADLDAHAASCAGCRAALGAQQFARAALTSLPPVHASPGFAAAVLSQIAGDTWFDRWDFRRWTWRLAPVAAALAMALYLTDGRAEAGDLAAPAEMSVADALLSEDVPEEDVVPLMLFADPSYSLDAALKEIEP